MSSKPSSVEEYLAQLPAERREALQAVRETILKNLPKGYEEGIQYGMIGYFVPHSLYPDGYHCDPTQPLPFAHLASQKNYMSLYLFCIYGDEESQRWFVEEWKKTGKKLDMGKSCVRFKSLEDLPLKVVGQAIKRLPLKRFVAFYEAAREQTSTRRKQQASSTTKKKSPKRASSEQKPTSTKKAAKKKEAIKSTRK